MKKKKEMKKEVVYTPREVSKMLKVSQATVYRWIKEKRIKALVLPSCQIRIPSSEIERLLALEE